MADTYQDAKLVPEEVAILEELEKILGEPIPNRKSSDNLKFGFVAKKKHVLSLGLSNKKLNSLPQSIGILSELTELFLSNNNIQELPESITTLRNLLKLDLWKNNFSDSSFSKEYIFLVNLHYLEVRGNKNLTETRTFGNYSENSFATKNDVKTFLNRFRK
ncbi:MAG: hypothetical protein HeimC3_48630 [Candidatus Heimdallarchaeota archaeon LC_3]|nr:MAG: hypothetical protein HeimC3_48630 [Candidatus Heimdallarchaeota archaeon LC_3]